MEPRISIVTLGVNDLEKSFKFYKEVLGLPSKNGIEVDVAFFQLRSIWLALYPKEKLAIDAKVANDGKGFPGFTLAHNLRSKEEVDAFFEKAKQAGVIITKSPQGTEWGGYSGYFQDPDGYLWEIAWNPHSWIE